MVEKRVTLKHFKVYISALGPCNWRLQFALFKLWPDCALEKAQGHNPEIKFIKLRNSPDNKGVIALCDMSL